MKPARCVAVLASAVALVAAACGEDDATSTAASTSEPVADEARPVEIQMVDIAFEPSMLEVSQGETVRFVFANTGEVDHDAFVGDEMAQQDHEAEMQEAEENDEMGHMGSDDDDNGVTVEPGETGELTYTFDEAGEVEIGCHQAGHYDSGMKVDVTVS